MKGITTLKSRIHFLAFLLILSFLLYCSDNIVSECKVYADDVPTGTVTSFSNIQQTIFNNSCVSCHSGSSPLAGLDLSEGVAYDNLVNVPSSGSNLQRVVPFNSSASYLFKVLDGTDAPLMPPGARLSQAKIDSVRSWIDRGAKND